MISFSSAEVANSYKTRVWTRWKFQGRHVAFVSNWLTKKVFKRSLLKGLGHAILGNFV